jgi:hypothetical protein
MSGHRYDYKRWKNGNKQRIYKSFEMFDEYGLENCKIVLIENYPCNSRDELTSREAHYIRTMTCVNRYIPDRSDEEYRNDPEHKERKKVVSKAYYESVLKQRNKEIIKCDCGCEIQQGYKSAGFRQEHNQRVDSFDITMPGCEGKPDTYSKLLFVMKFSGKAW